MKRESRSIEQLREHYTIEKELAKRLRDASQQERRKLYSSLYDELYMRVPSHPQLTRKLSAKESGRVVAAQVRCIKPFLDKSMTLLEVGPGDCALAFAVTKFVNKVYALDVSAEISKTMTRPLNFHFILSNGCNVPLPENSVNVAYSNQLMEHLHPDDAFEQLENIYRALVPGGVYICITPNRLSGPHDISVHFDEVASCFHLKEYTAMELIKLFNLAGFSEAKVYVGAKGKYIEFPALLIGFIETMLEKLPWMLRKTLARTLPFRMLLGVRLVGVK